MTSRRIATNRRTSRKGPASGELDAAVQAAKMQALYHFAYGLSHEINNPLANIVARAQTLLMDEKVADRRRKLSMIVQQAFRAHEMIADLMLFARPPSLELQSTNISSLAKTVVSEMQPLADEQATRLVVDGGPGAVATVDPVQISVALKALVQNSLEAVRTGGTVQVVVEYHGQRPRPRASKLNRAASSGLVKLHVIDDGPGIPDEVLPHIFDPFFCGREAGRGLGLGLSKAWRISELHGGRMDVVSDTQPGVTFMMTLPQVPTALTPSARK